MFPIYFIHRFKPLKMGPLCRLGFFLHYLVFSSCILLGCDVTIWDCGQGNMVTAFYKKEAIVFDAGSKAYQSFAQLAEDRDDESSSVAYTISSSEPPADSFFHEAPPSESVQKLRREQVDVLKEELLKDFYASFSNKRLKAVFISHPDLDHVNMINKNVINEMDPLPTFVLGGRPAHKNYAAIRSLNAPLVPEVDLKDQFKIKKCQFGGVSKTSIDILAANEGTPLIARV